MKTLGDIWDSHPDYREGRGFRVLEVRFVHNGNWITDHAAPCRETLLKDVIISPHPGDGVPPRLFNGWYEVRAINGKDYRGSQGIVDLMTFARAGTDGPVGRGVHIPQSRPVAVPFYFWDEIDAIEFKMKMDERSQ